MHRVFYIYLFLYLLKICDCAPVMPQNFDVITLRNDYQNQLTGQALPKGPIGSWISQSSLFPIEVDVPSIVSLVYSYITQTLMNWNIIQQQQNMMQPQVQGNEENPSDQQQKITLFQLLSNQNKYQRPYFILLPHYLNQELSPRKEIFKNVLSFYPSNLQGNYKINFPFIPSTSTTKPPKNNPTNEELQKIMLERLEELNLLTYP